MRLRTIETVSLMKRLGGRGDTPYLAVKGAKEGTPTISAAREIGRAHYRAKVAKRPYPPEDQKFLAFKSSEIKAFKNTQTIVV